ncbi:YdaU family protein [Stutzerimonas kunmingensis]|uniref:YdaU family protein n=1 Tax=Stutzerimonas kunmingensis TaxID=1211807 RepID=UPI000CE4E360|nr:YdaU family protein [Stutzerimonas kunmingensis]
MNFYPFHPGDYMLRTAHLDLIEDLAYRRLLDLYYINEQPLQGEPDAIARVIRMRSNVTEVAAVLGEFFTQTEAGWQHKRGNT